MTAGLSRDFIWGGEDRIAAKLGALASDAATDATLSFGLDAKAEPEALTADHG